MTEETISNVLTRIQETIDEKEGIFHTLAVQSVDIFEHFRKEDFDATIAELKVLFERQEIDLKTIERRNKDRIPNKNLSLNHICKLLVEVVKVRGKDPANFGIESKSDYNELTKQIRNYANAGEGAPQRKMSAGTSINVLFPRFLTNELGFQAIAELCGEVLKELKQQKAWVNGINDPSSIFEQLRRQGIEVMEVEKLPRDQKAKVKNNSQTVGLLPDSIRRERAILEKLEATALKYFPKSDILNAALLKIYSS